MFVRCTVGLITILGCASTSVDAPAQAAHSPSSVAASEDTPEESATRARKRKPRKRKRTKRRRPTTKPREGAPTQRPDASAMPEPLDAKTRAALLSAHNAAREQVGVAALTWSDEVAETARRWAGALAANGCALQHNPDKSYGENLYWTTQPAGGAQVTASWTSEAGDYDAQTHACASGKVCGHYTQVVWGDSRSLGCGMASCGSTQVWVCNYDPPGNYVGQHPF